MPSAAHNASADQLVAEAAEIPDLDEYSGMAVVDIAWAITGWPEGSEDQLRAIEAIRRRAPGLGHNRPPLGERLDEEFEALAARSADLMRVTATVAIVDDESGAKVVDMIRQCSTLEEDIAELRKALLKPYDDAIRLIADRAKALAEPIAIARDGPQGRPRGVVGGLRGLLTAYENKRQAEAEAERQRLREEQRQREQEAEEARRRAEEQAAAGRSSVVADLAAQDAQAAAERAAAKAEAIAPAPIRSDLGQATRRRIVKFEITDLRKYLGAILKDRTFEPRLRAFIETVADQQARSYGVDAIDKGVEYPGVRFWTEMGPISVRR